MDEAVNIANEIDRQGFMFEHGIREAPELADMDAHNQRVLYVLAVRRVVVRLVILRQCCANKWLIVFI